MESPGKHAVLIDARMNIERRVETKVLLEKLEIGESQHCRKAMHNINLPLIIGFVKYF